MSFDIIFSVITVCYNSEEHIGKCIESVHGQDFERFEHVIIDGNSSDETLNIIESLKSEKMVTLSEADKGIYDAMNKGIRLARGDYIIFLNSDDTFTHRSVLSELFVLVKASSPSVIYSGINYVNQSGVLLDTWLPKKFSHTELMLGWSTPHPGFVVHRTVFDLIGVFDIRYSIAADFDFILRCMLEKFFSVQHNSAIVNMFSSGASSTANGILAGSQDIWCSFKANKLLRYGIVHFLCRYLRKIPSFLRRRLWG